MNKGILKKILIIFLILILAFNLSYIVYAAGVVADDDELDPNPPPPPSPDPDPDPPPIIIPDPEPPPTYSIYGSIWEDIKNSVDSNGTSRGNGNLDYDEALIEDTIRVNLYKDGTYLTSTSSINGNYSFDNLESGNYQIEFTYDTENYNGLTHKSTYGPNDIIEGIKVTDSTEKRKNLFDLLLNITPKFISDLFNSALSSIDDSMTASSPEIFLDSDTEVNLPLEKLPLYSMQLSKEVTHITINLSDGSTLIDWDIDDYNNNITKKHLMYIPDNSLTVIMDDEITHGATINIEYTITIKNNSEVWDLRRFLPLSMIPVSIPIINSPTTYHLYDYLDNNLIFNDINNPSNWKYVDTNNMIERASNMDLSSFTILENEVTLEPNEEKKIILNASKIMTIADTDLLTYNNYVELIAYKNEVLGRILTYENDRCKFIQPGNLNIYDETREYEPDEAKAETVTRVPPFGKDLSYYTTIVGIIVLAIEIIILSTLKYKIKHLRKKYIRKR